MSDRGVQDTVCERVRRYRGTRSKIRHSSLDATDLVGAAERRPQVARGGGLAEPLAPGGGIGRPSGATGNIQSPVPGVSPLATIGRRSAAASKSAAFNEKSRKYLPIIDGTNGAPNAGSESLPGLPTLPSLPEFCNPHPTWQRQGPRRKSGCTTRFAATQNLTTDFTDNTDEKRNAGSLSYPCYP